MKKIFMLLFIISFHVNAQCLWKSIHESPYRVTGIKDDNTIWTWGLLDGGYINGVVEPVQIGNDSNWLKLSVGDSHYLAIKSDGTLWAWGNNYFGQLGIPYNPNDNLSLPIQVGTDNDWIDISAASTHSCAIKSNGTLWTWGYNDYGQLGNGTWSENHLPTQVGVDTDWRDVESKYRTTIAIKTNNTIWGWGKNNLSQLGNGNNVTVNSPIQIGNNSSDWKIVRTSNNHCIALKNDNTLWAWGNNSYGELGNGTNINLNFPTQIGNGDDWRDLSVGASFSLALKADHTLWSWGDNSRGQLGDGTQINKNIPTQITSLNDCDKIVNYPYYTSFVIKQDKTLWGWGSNVNGQLLIGNIYGLTTEFQNILNPMLNTCSVLINSENIAYENEIKIYPNPSSYFIYISNATDKIIDTITICNINGQILKVQNKSFNKIDVSDLANGLYFINLTVGEKAFSFKFIKE